MRVVLPSLVLIASLSGCGEPPIQHGGPGSITLGTTTVAGEGFFALEGDQVLVPGSQGGFHVWLKYRIKGMSPGKVMVKRTARRVSDNRLILTTEASQEIGPMGEAGYWEAPTAIPSFMCPSPLGVKVFDIPVVFDVKVVGPDGTTLAEATAEATPHCPIDDQAEFCRNICSG
jgi:hypothetical protein